MVLYSYYKRKLAVTSAVVVLLCRLISLFLNFTFYSSVNNAQSWRRNVGGSYKYYTCVVFRSSRFGNSSILSFHFFIIQNVKQDEYMKQNGHSLPAFDQKFTVLFFFFRQEGYNAEFGWNFYRKLSKSIFAFTKAFSLCRQQVIWSFTHNEKFLFTHGSSESLCLRFFSSVMISLQIKQTLNHDSTDEKIENVLGWKLKDVLTWCLKSFTASILRQTVKWFAQHDLKQNQLTRPDRKWQ